MTADDTIRKLAAEQRKRLIAGILTHAETEFYRKLSRREQVAFREKVMASVNVYHDFILDLIKVNREDVIRSEESVTLLRQVHESQMRLEQEQACSPSA